MLLKPYSVMMKAIHTYTEYECLDSYNRTSMIGYPYNSNMMSYPLNMCRFSGLATFLTSYPSSGNNGVVFGDGTKEPEFTDNRLSGNLITTLSVTGNRLYETDENGVTYTGLYTITNIGSSEVTISEVGYIHGLPRGTSAYSNAFMIDRTLLDEPVTIPAGGIGQVTYTIRVDLPV